MLRGTESKLLPVYGIELAFSRCSDPPTGHCTIIWILPLAVVNILTYSSDSNAICVPPPRWPRGLRYGFAAARLLGLRVRTPSGGNGILSRLPAEFGQVTVLS